MGPCNESAVNSTTVVVGGPKPFKPCTPGSDCSKKEKFTKCVKDVVKLPEEDDRENTNAPMGGIPHVTSAGNDTFVRKCRSMWWPHPMCESERALIHMMMPKAKNGSDIIQPASADERALWIEGKTRAASNCAMCEVLLDFKVAEAELKIELEGAKWKVFHNETIPPCPAPCTVVRNDTMVTRQRAKKVAELKIQRKQEELDRIQNVIVMLADMEAACPRLMEHFEGFELELRTEMEEWSGLRIAQREICRKMRCCS